MQREPPPTTVRRPGRPTSTRRAPRAAPRRSVPPTRPRKLPPARRHAEIRQARRRVLLGLYILLGLVSAYGLLWSPAMRVRRVQVSGLQSLPPDEARLTLRALSLAADTNWVRAPLAPLQRGAARLPWVRSVGISRRLSLSLACRVVARQPLFLARSGTAQWEVDDELHVVRPARPEAAAHLPQVILDDARALAPGQILDSDGLDAAREIARRTPALPFLHGAKIEVDLHDNLCLNMQEGLRIQLGSASDLEKKLSLAARVYQRDPQIAQTLAEINLTCPTAPACVLRPLAAPLTLETLLATPPATPAVMP